MSITFYVFFDNQKTIRLTRHKYSFCSQTVKSIIYQTSFTMTFHVNISLDFIFVIVIPMSIKFVLFHSTLILKIIDRLIVIPDVFLNLLFFCIDLTFYITSRYCIISHLDFSFLSFMS